ncbi:uncharacterized protein BDV17DRAFT_293968 [Aspergillus undulatus]|uniref:uncharacterized protein n=1 Tax=Aspergillus undulatus TaxID=1810928 RepID=UPI003CCCD8DA
MPLTSMNMGKSSSPATSSRNIAFMAIASVIGGGYALLRYQSPRGNQGIVKEDDIENETGATKLGRSKIVSQGDVDATMGDAPAGQGASVGRSQRKASHREDF